MKDINELILFLSQDSKTLFREMKWIDRNMEIFMSIELTDMLMNHLNTFPKELVSVAQVLDDVEVGSVSYKDIFVYENIRMFRIKPDIEQKTYSIQKLF